MGLISAIKELFNKNIECGSDVDNHIVFFAKKYKRLYLHKSIIVRDNTNCVVVYKNRVADVLVPGKYKINADTLPDTFGRIKLSKGGKVKKIPCRLYFVNTKEFTNFEFVSKKPFKAKSSNLGRVKGCMKGSCAFKTLDSGIMLRWLISNGCCSTDKIAKFLSCKIGDAINRKIIKNKINLNSLLFEQERVEKILNTDLEDFFDKNGFYIKNIKLKAVDFSKKHREKINDIMSSKKRVVANYNINVGNQNTRETVTVDALNQGTTQSGQTHVNINTFVLCKHCGKRNNITSKNCIGCGKKIY